MNTKSEKTIHLTRAQYDRIIKSPKLDPDVYESTTRKFSVDGVTIKGNVLDIELILCCLN